MTQDQKRLINELAVELDISGHDISEKIFAMFKKSFSWPDDAYRLTHQEASELIDELIDEKRMMFGSFYD